MKFFLGSGNLPLRKGRGSSLNAFTLHIQFITILNLDDFELFFNISLQVGNTMSNQFPSKKACSQLDYVDSPS
jgi:hypothetical protein